MPSAGRAQSFSKSASTQSAAANILARLARAGNPVAVERNAFIYRQAQKADSVYYVQTGLVKIDSA